jgi:hypothetical protein
MTITLYLQKETFLRDLTTLQQIFNAGIPELVEPLGKFMQPLNISISEWNPKHNIVINVTPEEFALIGIFNGGI